MGKIVVSENVTLDGVMQDPTGDEGCSFGGWFNPATAPDRESWAEAEFEEAMRSEALLLGARTYRSFAGRWPSRVGEWADRLNSMPKYVVSATMGSPEWNNTTVLTGDAVQQVSKLRQELDGDLVVYGSGRLARALLAHDLVDEVRLMVHPIVAGGGEGLFDRPGPGKALRRVDVRTVGAGLALLSYQSR